MLEHLPIASLTASPTTLALSGRSSSSRRDRGAPQPAQPRLDFRDLDRRRARLCVDRLWRRRPRGRHRRADAPRLPDGDARPRARRRLEPRPPHRLGETRRARRQRSRMPFTATLFEFGVFSVMGLSPFKGSFSKFIVLYAAIEHGLWPVTSPARRDHRRRGLRPPRRPEGVHRASRDGRARARPGAAAIAWPLTALTVRPQPVAGAVPALRRAPRRLPGAEGVPQFNSPWARRSSSPMSAASSLSNRAGSGQATRRRRRPAGDRDRRRRRPRRQPRPGLATVRAAVLRRLLPDDRLFDRLHRPRRDRQSLLLLRLPDGRLADRRRYGARARQFLRLLGADDLDVVLPGHPRTDPQGAARRPRLLPDVRGGRLSDEFRHPADARRRSARSSSPRSPTRPASSAARRRGHRRLPLRRLRSEDGSRPACRAGCRSPTRSAVVDLRPAVGRADQGRRARHGQGALRRVRRRRARALRGRRPRRQHRADDARLPDADLRRDARPVRA